jgi:hypothetical protein
LPVFVAQRRVQGHIIGKRFLHGCRLKQAGASYETRGTPLQTRILWVNFGGCGGKA